MFNPIDNTVMQAASIARKAIWDGVQLDNGIRIDSIDGVNSDSEGAFFYFRIDGKEYAVDIRAVEQY